MQMSAENLRGYLDYLRDLGVYDLYRHENSDHDPNLQVAIQSFVNSLGPLTSSAVPRSNVAAKTQAAASVVPRSSVAPPLRKPTAMAHEPLRAQSAPNIVISPLPMPRPPVDTAESLYDTFPSAAEPFAPPSMPLVSFNQLAPLQAAHTPSADKPVALLALREHIGDCTRCPLAYAGRHTIVFADGNPDADLMFVGEGPGADEDISGVPFVGKAGQLLNNMITAMGLKREQVYIANIVKCRPPKNRVPEPLEANTCSQFLLQQIDIVRPKIIVALGSTAATYLLGVKQSLMNLRGQWHDVRGAKCAVTYHPAFLLRDPRQKGEAWKDLQRVMTELNLKPPVRA